MDYLGWELERQRAALTALLLGDGTVEENNAVRDGERGTGDSGRGPAAGRGSAKEAGRYAENPERGFPGAWETVRRARQDRGFRQEGPGTAVSAWEEIFDTAAAADVLDRKAWGVGREAREESGGTAPKGGIDLPSGGTGALDGGPDGWVDQGIERETAVEQTSTVMRAFVGERSAAARADGEETVGGTSPAMGSGGEEAAGSNTAIRRFEWTGGVRRGGGVIETPDRPGGSRELEDSSGAAGPWGGRWGTAALQADNDAKALSRAVQRDARRYDGGFMIY